VRCCCSFACGGALQTRSPHAPCACRPLREHATAGGTLSACARRRQGEDKAALLKAVAQALYASKICSYAQGMNIIRAKSMEKDWGIEMGSLARIWKARARAPRAGARHARASSGAGLCACLRAPGLLLAAGLTAGTRMASAHGMPSLKWCSELVVEPAVCRHCVGHPQPLQTRYTRAAREAGHTRAHRAAASSARSSWTRSGKRTARTPT